MAKINTQKEKLVQCNRKNYFPQNTKNIFDSQKQIPAKIYCNTVAEVLALTLRSWFAFQPADVTNRAQLS